MAKIRVNNTNIRIPHGQTQLKSLPDDPEGSSVYGYETEEASAVIMVSPVKPEDAMPFDDKQLIIDSIHTYLSEDQGLVQVENGKTEAGRPYIFSVVKSRAEEGGVQYTLTMQIAYTAWVLSLQGFFDEKGTAGTREAAVLEQLRSRGRFTENLKGWTMDPYDAAYRKGLLMNLSEMPHLDGRFPGHPLTMLRSFAAYLAANN